jgi:signal transduction histidine kinase
MPDQPTYSVEEIRALAEAGINLTSELSLRAVLQKVVDSARDTIGARYAALSVLSEDGRIEQFISSGITEAERAAIGHIPFGKGLVGVLLHEGTILRLEDISADPRSVGFPPNHPPMTSLLGVPVVWRGRIIGNLYLTEKTRAPSFDQRDEELLRLLAAQAAVAISNASLYELRTEFLSTVAHELRTPLTSVRTSVGLLMDPTIDADPEIHQTLLENISNSADRMQHLVNDLLDLARFRSGNLYLQVQQFDARELVRAAADAVKILTRERRQRLNVRLPKRAVHVMGDRWRLEQALINLLSNASKFSPEDSTIKLKVKLVGGDVEWSVSDEGPGIEPEDMSRLFERFFTRRRDTSGSSSGAGLGLPIALAVAQAHGGTIDVESRLKQGSTFTLRVPKEHQEGTST